MNNKTSTKRVQSKTQIFLSNVSVTSKKCVIVIPEKAAKTEKKAAKEFQLHIRKCSGEKLEIVQKCAPKSRFPVYIGRVPEKTGFKLDDKKLGGEGIYLENNGKSLLLAGGVRGALYAVYAFLEEYLGIHWYSSDCVKFPQNTEIHIGEFQKEYIPPFEYRCTDYPVSRPLDFAVRNMYNGQTIQSKPEWGGSLRYILFVHTFARLVPPEIYAEKHPEYYSYIDGKRDASNTQLCLTNPEVLKIALNTVMDLIRKNPEKKIISVSQNDNQRYCHCEKCMALAEKEESQAGPLLHFVNAIAKEVAKEFPDVIIDTLAYQYTRKPPKYVKPEPNVAIRLCSIECCFTHSLEECPENASFKTDIEEWSKICRRLHIWDYVINYANCLAPLPNIRVLQPNIRFFREYGVTGIYEEAAYFSPGTEMAPLRSWLMAKLLWNPDIDVNNAVREFTDAYFGEAGLYIREYIDLIHDEVCDKRKIHLGIYVNPRAYLSDDILAKAMTIFDNALKAVKRSRKLTGRVETERLAVLYSILSDDSGFIFKREIKPEERELVRLFRRAAKNIGLTHIYESNTPELSDWLNLED